MICKGCNKPILDPKPLIVFEGADRIPAYFHGKDCWNDYKGEAGVLESNYPQLRSGFMIVSSDEALPLTQDNKESKCMAKLIITPQDMKRSTVLDQGWYPIEVTAVTEEPNSKGDSTNIIVDMVGLTSSDPDKNKAAGVPLRRYFTEKAPGFAVNFIKACGVSVGDDGGTFDISSSVGRKMEAFVKPRPYEGRMTNDVSDFRKLEG